MFDNDTTKMIDEMPRFTSSQEKIEWAESVYQALCAEEGEPSEQETKRVTMMIPAPSPSHPHRVSGTVRLEKGQYLELRSPNPGRCIIVIQEADKT